MPTPVFLGGQDFLFYNQNNLQSKKNIIIGSNNNEDIKIKINVYLSPLFIIIQTFLYLNMILIIILIIQLLNKDNNLFFNNF